MVLKNRLVQREIPLKGFVRNIVIYDTAKIYVLFRAIWVIILLNKLSMVYCDVIVPQGNRIHHFVYDIMLEQSCICALCTLSDEVTNLLNLNL